MKWAILLLVLMACAPVELGTQQYVEQEVASEPVSAVQPAPALEPEIVELPKAEAVVPEPEPKVELSCLQNCENSCAESAQIACSQNQRSQCKQRCGEIIDPSACTQACTYLSNPKVCKQQLEKFCNAQCVGICH